MKKIRLILALMLILTGCSRDISDVESSNTDNFEKEKVQAEGTLWIGEKELEIENSMMFFGGRLYLPTTEIQQACGRALDKEESLIHEEFLLNGETYFSINDIAKQLDLWTIFEEGGVRLYLDYEIEGIWVNIPQNKAEGIACLRLEDIMADTTKDSNFTHENLEKLRVMGRWLSARNQEYSIAWIPLYTNPKMEIQNNLINTANFYNADFIYTLDELIANGGHIGLHGLTHQSGDEISSYGYEFGKDTIFSQKQIRKRMIKANDMAKFFGYTAEFFEFPHYGITDDQEVIAEELFSVIYQQKMDRTPFGKLEWTERNGKEILYVPTPADHVRSIYDKQNMIDKINTTASENLVSLFFHPYLDEQWITCLSNKNGKRVLTYSSEGILPSIFKTIKDKELSFQIPW